ncbi:MAG: M56 family metallopeptidase [Clostridiales bacterium]|nr:M56 family metallopeptidase [Clostridiales bacterium]
MSLIEMSVTGSVMILCIAALRLLFGRWLPRWTFHALWVAAALRLVLPLSVTLPVSAQVGAASAAQAVTEAVQTRLEPAAGSASGQEAASVVGGAAALQSVTPAQVLGAVWLAGSLVLAALCLYGYLRCMARFRASLPDDTPEVRRWLEEHRLRRPLEVRVSDQITSPLTYGVRYPVILLPKQMDRQDGSALQYVLAHELVHVRRWDAVTKLLFAAALCVHWWNPLVWLLYILANRDVELSCDEAVLRQFGSGAGPAYARTLLRMAEPGSVSLPFYNGFGKHVMKERIVAIMKFKRKSAFLTIAALVLVAAAVVFAVSGTADDTASYAQLSILQADEDALASYEALGLVLTDEDAFALLDIGESTPVLLVADGTFDDGVGNAAAIRCSAYYAEGGTLYDLGDLESPESISTAYSIRIGNGFLYTASNSSLEQYRLDADGRAFVLDVQYRVVYDSNGGETYYCVKDGAEEPVTEETFAEAFSAYEEASVVAFEDA